MPSSGGRARALNARFGVVGVTFREGPGGLESVEVENHHATASVALQGAHLLAWTPRDEEPVIWVSEAARYEPGVPIRGGIPHLLAMVRAAPDRFRPCRSTVSPARPSSRRWRWSASSTSGPGSPSGSRTTAMAPPGPTRRSRLHGHGGANAGARPRDPQRRPGGRHRGAGAAHLLPRERLPRGDPPRRGGLALSRPGGRGETACRIGRYGSKARRIASTSSRPATASWRTRGCRAPSGFAKRNSRSTVVWNPGLPGRRRVTSVLAGRGRCCASRPPTRPTTWCASSPMRSICSSRGSAWFR